MKDNLFNLNSNFSFNGNQKMDLELNYLNYNENLDKMDLDV